MDGLRIKQLSTGYAKKWIVPGLIVPALERGKVTILLGPNGCGKSTMMRALAGLNRAKGEVLLDGEDLLSLSFSGRAKKVVYLPQSLPEGVHLHVIESVEAAQRASGRGDRTQQKNEIIMLLTRLGIGHLALHYLDQLSGGQKQMVGLAQSLVRSPSVLLLDEPLSALDLNHQFHVMELVRNETRKRNMVTVVVVHDINTALRHGDHILMLRQGKLVASGKPEEVITAENLASVYGVNSRVERCSRGIMHIVLDGLISAPDF
jgi:iron complex transport system ATP-binding protein